MKRRIAVLTTGRQDWGILRSTCRALAEDPRFELWLIVGGMHVSATHGASLRDVESEGLPIRRRLATEASTPAGEAAKMIAELSNVLEVDRVEALLLAGDRSETAAAALAATISRTPIVHLHGGEETEGAIDNVLRHAITKLSHLHLVSHPDHARRVLQMGEAAESVRVVGAPGLDNLRRTDLPDRAELERDLGLALPAPLVLVTYHPTTLGGAAADEVRALVAALAEISATYVISLPNNDSGSEEVRRSLSAFAEGHATRIAAEALGARRYFGLLRCADAMVGNSSSAIIEAPVFALPAINIGDRQKGRLRGSNVIDVPVASQAIVAALRDVLAPGYRKSRTNEMSPYGDGRSAERIVACLADWMPPNPPRKPFVDRELSDHG